MTIAHAPGKIILVGEHAVVYGRPAIAVPVTQIQARVTVEEGEKEQGIVILAKDLGRVFPVGQRESKSAASPLQATIVNVLTFKASSYMLCNLSNKPISDNRYIFDSSSPNCCQSVVNHRPAMKWK